MVFEELFRKPFFFFFMSKLLTKPTNTPKIQRQQSGQTVFAPTAISWVIKGCAIICNSDVLQGCVDVTYCTEHGADNVRKCRQTENGTSRAQSTTYIA